MNHSIGIAMTTYNGELFIEKQIESILHQTLKPDIIIISDDASTDKTPEIIHRYARRNRSIQFHQNSQNAGFTKNFEKAISLCDTDIVFISDQDNIWIPEKTETCVNFMTKYPDAGLCYHNSNLILSDDRLLDYTLWDLSPTGYPIEINNAKKMLPDCAFSLPGFTIAFNSDLRKNLLPLPEFVIAVMIGGSAPSHFSCIILFI